MEVADLIVNTIIAAATIVTLAVSMYFSRKSMEQSEKSLRLTRESDSRARAATAFAQLSDDSVYVRIAALGELRELFDSGDIDKVRLHDVLNSFIRTIYKNGRADFVAQHGELNKDNLFKPDEDFFKVAELLTSIYDKTEKRANLDEMDMSYTDLHDVVLCGACLFLTNLSGAHLGWANLSGADLQGANLSGALLGWANLSGADLQHNDLSRALNLTQKQIDSAITDKDTILPDYLTKAGE